MKELSAFSFVLFFADLLCRRRSDGTSVTVDVRKCRRKVAEGERRWRQSRRVSCSHFSCISSNISLCCALTKNGDYPPHCTEMPVTQRLLVSRIIQPTRRQGGEESARERKEARREKRGEGRVGCLMHRLHKRRCSYLMLVIKAGFEHGRRFCYFPTALEPSPCDSPPLHPGKLSA